jgi:hypothetical protein
MGELSLEFFASCLKGKVCRGSYVSYPCPGTAGKKGYKGKRHTGRLWLAPDDSEGFRVHSHHADNQDWRTEKDRVKALCGIRWEPKKRTKPAPSFKERNQFFGESLRPSHHLGRITVEQFNLLINDLRPKDPATKAAEAHYYAALFGFSSEIVEQALKARHRTYTAAERAEIWQLPYEVRQRLKLKRTRWVGADGRAVDWETVDKARRARDHAKKRVKRARARAARVARENLRQAVIRRSGVNRQIPSSSKVYSNSYIDTDTLASAVVSDLDSNRSESYPRKPEIKLKPGLGIRSSFNQPPPKCAHASGKITRARALAQQDHEEMKAALLRLAKAK